MGGFGNKMNFFENNSKLEPHKILVNFIQNNPSIKTAIDLGCGAGRDTKFLVQNNIIVTAIDRVDVTKFLYKDLTEEEKNYEYKKTPEDIFMNLCILEDTIGKSLMVTSSLNE